MTEAETRMTLDKLRKRRASIKSKLTIFKNYINNLENDLANPEFIFPENELKLRLSRSELLLNQFEEIQTEIDCQVDDVQDESAQSEQFENDYFGIIAKAETLLSKHTASVGESSNVKGNPHEHDSSHSGVSSKDENNHASLGIKLPTVQLPRFSGNYENWLEFHDSFQSMIIKNVSISLVQKFHYLKSSVSGVAEKVIHSIPVSSENFSVAWQMLCERFANRELLVYNHTKCIFNLQKIIKQSSFNIRQLVDGLQSNLRSLQSLNEPVDHWDTLLIFLIVEKLDSETTLEWESKKSTETTLKDLLNFLKTKADILEKIEANHFSSGNKDRNRFQKKSLTRSLISSQASCFLCKSSNHKLSNCRDFLNLSITDRTEQAKKLKVCLNCLHPGHVNSNCKYGKCYKCGKKHHTLIHVETTEIAPNVISSASEADSNIESTHALSTSAVRKNLVLLSTVVVQVLDSSGKAQECRALLDSGSQSNFISSHLVSKLGLPKRRIDISVIGIAQTSSNMNYQCNVFLRSLHSSFSASLTCLVTNAICNQLPGCQIDISSLRIPANIQLSDKNFHVNSDIHLLIGAGLFYNLLCVGQINLGPQNPVLQKTKLGWIISGPLPQVQPSQNAFCNFSHNSVCDELSRFWEIEEFPTTRFYSKEEEHCEEHFKSTLKRNSDGRFVVSMPFKDSVEKLGESRSTAEKRFYSVERKLQHNSTLKKMYIEFMEEYVSMGHMTQVDHHQPFSYYLPHHGVLKKDSLTTKLRVVFDGSSPSSSGLSLNDVQMVGPVVQSDLLSIVLRFRQHSHVVSADIAKFYRQILVCPSQRHFQQILWRSDPCQPLQTFSLNTVTYGTASASFLATRCLSELAQEYSESFPEATNIIANDFYVDDLLTGSDSVSEIIVYCKQIIHILSKAHLPLRKWVSNNPSILDAIQQSVSSLDIAHSLGSNDNTKTLGLHWYPKFDSLRYVISSEILPKTITKRSILSGIAQIFDPLGLLCPATIQAKMLLQQLWLEKLGWDHSVPLHIHTSWLAFRDQLPQLNDIQIARKVKLDNAVHIELHGFCDSSELAFGSAIYIRSLDQSGNVQTHLLCAKSKVAPLKKISIPRLELCAAVILSRLATKVFRSLSLKFNKIFYWSDSMVVLGWLKISPHLLKTFVANRVSEIQSNTDISCWNHVNTKENPADLISRGISPQSLKSSDLWWHGPKFLNDSIQICSTQPLELTNELPEMKRTEITSLNLTALSSFPFERFSTLNRLKRTFAYILRFVHNSLARFRSLERNSGPLSMQELNSSLRYLIKYSQAESFPEELHNLSKGKPLPRKSRMLSLLPFIDENGILRVGGRLRHSPYEFDKKHPIIISSNHHFSKLLFHNEHKKLLHAGPHQLLYSIRETYWPILGKNLAKRTVHECIVCFKAKPISINPLMGDLPEARVTPFLPFINTGVDYAGPFTLRDKPGRRFKTYKGYVSLFICLSTKAVHIELVSDLTSDAFISALKRFIARRGKPQSIYSDNGTNFVGSKNQLLELGKFLKNHSEEIESSTSCQEISWHFIPAYSPHFGGIWEAGVKSMKRHLKRVLSEALLTYENFQTVLVQVEAILNSRPLTPLTSDPSDLTALTPSHFLIGRTLTSIPEHNFMDIKVNRLDQFERLQQLRQHLWKRWSLEYISELQGRQKWRENKSQMNIGDLVIIKDCNLSPLQWKLGRVIQLFPGSDNIPRVAALRTVNGEIRRAISNLCPLPLSREAVPLKLS